MEKLDILEQAVLDKLLAGEHPALAVLRRQATMARVAGRKNTGVGFFCDFEVDESAPTLLGDFQIGDVFGELEGLAHGAGFVLFIRDGQLSMLEGFTFDEPWPQQLRGFKLAYQHEPRELLLPEHLSLTSPGDG
jgi:hypothetical protein